MSDHTLPTFDLRLLAPFAILGEELHFGRAAARLGLAQPALSQQIGRLEQQLGVKLLLRGSRGVTLTPAGARFLSESRAIVARAGEIEARMPRPRGELRVHIGLAEHPIVRTVVASFAAQHPDLGLRTLEGPGSTSMQALADGEADLGFDLPGGAPEGMTCVILNRAPLGVMSPAGHPLAGRESALWTELDGETIFLSPPGIADAWSDLVRRALRSTGSTPVELVGPRVTRAEFLIDSIISGRALIIMPSYALDPPPAGTAWTRLEPRREQHLAAVFDERAPSDALRQFIAHVRTYAAPPVEAEPVPAVLAQAIRKRAMQAQAQAIVNSGEITVRTDDGLNPWLVRAVASFGSAFPQLRLNVLEGTLRAGAQAVADGLADVGFGMLEGVPTGLAYVSLDRRPFGVACPRGHWLAQAESVTWSDLNGEPVFVPPPGYSEPYRRALHAALLRAGVAPVEVRGPGAKPSFLVSRVLAGQGLVVCPDYVIAEWPEDIIWRALEPGQMVDNGLAWNRENASETTTQFVSWMAATAEPAEDSAQQFVGAVNSGSGDQGTSVSLP